MGVAEVEAVLRANTSHFTAKMEEAQAKAELISKAGSPTETGAARPAP
jgi:hypothetical protein